MRNIGSAIIIQNPRFIDPIDGGGSDDDGNGGPGDSGRSIAMDYSRCLETTITTNDAAAMEIYTAGKPIRITEVTLVLGAATASRYGIAAGVSGVNMGLIPTALSVPGPIAHNPNYKTTDNGADLRMAVAWGTAPTPAPTSFIEIIPLPATIGEGRVIQLPRGFTITSTRSLVIWNLATNSASALVTVRALKD